MSLTPSAGSEPGPADVERLNIEAARARVYGRRPDAGHAAAATAARYRQLELRAGLLAAIAATDGGDPAASRQLTAAIEAVRALAPTDADTRLDLDVASFLAEPSATVEQMSEALEAAAAGNAGPDGLISLVDRLFDRDHPDQAVGLCWLIVNRLAQGMPTAESGRAGAGAGAEAVAQTSPEAISGAPRRLLERIRTLIEARLQTAPDDRQLLVLRAAALFTSGDAEQALAVAEHARELRPDDSEARWIGIVALARLGRHEETLAEFEKLPPATQSLSSAVSIRMQALANLGRYDEAHSLIDVIPTEQRTVELESWHAVVMADAGRLDESLDAFEQLSRRHPDRLELLRWRAEILRRADRSEEAIAVLAPLADGDGRDVDALRQLAELYSQRGSHEQALAELERALGQAPDRVDLLLLRAQALQGAGREVAALQSAERAVAIDPGDQQAPVLVGEILNALGRAEEAGNAYVEAFRRLSPSDAAQQQEYVRRVEQTVNQLTDDGAYEAALRVADALRVATALPAWLSGTRAELLRVSHRFADAVIQAEEAIDAGADALWMAGTKAASLVELGHSLQALPVIESALEQSPDNLFGRQTQLRALSLAGRVTDALALLDERLANLDGAEPFATLARSALLNNLGRYEDTAALLEPLIRAARDGGTGIEADWLIRLGTAQQRLGNLEQGVANLREAVEITGADAQPWALIILADALKQAGDADQATPLYELAVTTNQNRERLLSLTEAGWAHFRLGELDQAFDAFDTAFGRSGDPLLFERTKYALMTLLVGEEPAAAAALEELLGRFAALGDRDHAFGMLAEARYLCAVLAEDPSWRGRSDRLQAAATRLATQLKA